MISSREELSFYLDADKYMLARKRKRPLFTDHVWKYQIFLRKTSYYSSRKNFIHKLLYLYYAYRKYVLGLKLGFDIGCDAFGPGLRINHFGNIVVSNSCKIGMWCDIHQGVNIGANMETDGVISAPVIGDNVWIGPGAKIFGRITIKNGVAIGANCVVNKNVEMNCTVVGVPAKKVKESGTSELNVAASSRRSDLFWVENPQYVKYKNQMCFEF